MSIYYVHSAQAVSDLMAGKTTVLPVVVFESAAEAAKYPDLIGLHNVKVFGIFQSSPEMVPMFYIGDYDFMHANIEQPNSKPLVMFPELVGEYDVAVVRPNGQTEPVAFINEIITLAELFNYLYKLYKQTLLDSSNIDLGDIPINTAEMRTHLNDSKLACVSLDVDQPTFDMLFAGMERVDNALVLSVIPNYLRV